MLDIRWQRVLLVVLTVIGICLIPLLWWFRSAYGDLVFSVRPCFFPTVWHLYCPGCGGTRAVNLLLDGNLLGSVLANPTPVCLIPLFIRIWGVLLYNSMIGYKKKMIPPLTITEIWVLFVAYIVYGIIRNVLLVFFHIDYLGDLAVYWQ